MSNKFSEWYARAFDKARVANETLDPRAVALKGLEEYTEFLFAAGVPSHRIIATFYQAVSKETARGTKAGDREALTLEVADVHICLAIFCGLEGIPLSEVDASIQQKHAINEGRPQRINEFGSLSHKKDV